MHLLRHYWPHTSQGDPVEIASQRTLAAFCILAGLSGSALTLLNMQYLPEYALHLCLSSITAAVCLLSPLWINQSRHFVFRARLVGLAVLILLSALSVLNNTLINASNFLFVPCTLTFTLALGWRTGAASVLISITIYIFTFFYAPAAQALLDQEVDLQNIFAALIVSQIIVFVGATVFRRQMLSLAHKLEIARNQAIAANNAKSEFLANMNHELRSPMVGILGLTQILEKSDLDAKQSEYLHIIHHSGEHLLALMNDTLDLAKVEARQLELEAVRFSFVETLTELGALYSALSIEAKIDFAITYDEDFDRGIERVGDRTRLNQVLHNLLSNAFRFAAEGQVRLQISNSDSPGQVRLCVSDTGEGMTSEQVSRVFEPFVQATPATSREFGGTGLGLTIVAQLVKLMNGTIAVESEPGTGSHFIVNLPLPPAKETRLVASEALANVDALATSDVP
jgi:signal transduction histidine kinase